jgi:starch synthase
MTVAGFRYHEFMRVLYVTSEIFPLAKSGGLADVSRALPLALKRQGFDVRIILPGYSEAVDRLEDPRIECWLPPQLGVDNAALITGRLPGTKLAVWLIYAPSLYSRGGGLYQDRSGRDWPDNALRFAYLARVAAHIARGALCGWKADIIHANDWHAGLVPLYVAMSGGSRPGVVFSIHNLAFQGNFRREAMAQLGVPVELFTPDGVEFYGSFSFLKAALRYSDKIVAVSPTYGREILTPEFGCGFEGILKARRRDLSGILNGIDGEMWDPATDPALVQRYSARNISGKRMCKADLQRELGLDVAPDIPLFAFCSRLTHQKMADILAEAMPAIQASAAVEVAIVGDGDRELTKEFSRLADQYSGRVSLRPYQEALAHRLFAGADVLLSPARYEPCGLTQLYALKYGAVPIVRKTGGLADTVVDVNSASLLDLSATGFAFQEIGRAGLLDAVSRALTVYQEPLAWRRLQLSGMNQDFSWRLSSQRYGLVYRSVSGLPIPAPLRQEPDVGAALTALSA